MKKKDMTELERNNRTAMSAHFINTLVMLMFIALQVMSGIASGTYLMWTALLGLGPVAAEFFFWSRNHETGMIRHLVAMGFAVFYTAVLFTSTNNFVFVFAIPMIMIVTVYNDEKYIVLINSGTIIESIVISILGANTGKYGYNGLDHAMIQVVIMILVAIYSFSTTRTMKRNNERKITQMEQAQKQTQKLLEDMSIISQKLKSGIEDMDIGLKQLGDNSNTTKTIMSDLTSRAEGTANAVRKQTKQTEAIQTKVHVTSIESNDIIEKMQQTLQVIHKGKEAVDYLVESTAQSVNNGRAVADKLKTLDTYIEQMNSIVALINNIAGQTTMLSLNASIEAARAGDAGRGFAVVATQISEMAAQTKDATINIDRIIENVTSSINEMVGEIVLMIDGIEKESESTGKAEESFLSIQENAVGINCNIEHLTENITMLKEANEEIAAVVQTISENAEQVNNQAAQTMNAEEVNRRILDSMEVRMTELMQLIKE